METERIACAIYARVSTVGQIRGEFTSIDSQVAYCRSFIESKADEGWYPLQTEYIDAGFSGSNLNRPGLQKLLADVDTGKVKAVAAYRYDRISRNNMEFHILCHHLESQGVMVFSVTEKMDSNDPTGKAMRSMAAIMSQLESDTTRMRTLHKIAAAKRQGRFCGGLAPLGYRIHPDGGKLEIDLEESEMVKTIANLYLQKRSLLAVAEILNSRGWRTKRHVSKSGKVYGGRCWSKTTVHHVLTNPAIVGEVRHKNDTYPAQHPAILDRGIWNQVQEVLKANRRNHGATIRNTHRHLLRGLVYCKSCKTLMSPTVTKKDGRSYKYLVCSSATRDGWHTCPRPSVSASRLEHFVVGIISSIGKNGDLQKETLQRVRESLKERRPTLKAERQRVQADLRMARAEIDNLLAGIGSGQASGPSVNRRLGELEGQVETLNGRVAEIGDELDLIENGTVDQEDLAQALQEFSAIWDLLHIQEKERVIHLLIDRIDFAGPDQKLAVTLSDVGILTLANEVAAEKEVQA